ncbi:hypothetical protein J5N97_022374 [Dioscorea zingiberensis]|uniref:Lactate/malate dehydrogenase C-terminal domain-containing protein n=1 Tax=Dioscorea zingiberensis TaxID=325984 RepID=A0A9D5HAS2_9LILI|nr:hypothetical protein J5N97_022374 [Dioscorea zingiberensis]
MVVSNRMDMLTYIAWKLSRFLPNRVIGSGTNLDSSRFRFLRADNLQVNAQDVQAYIAREHGDSSVALWSSISVGGVPVLGSLKHQQIAYEDSALECICKAVVQSTYEGSNEEEILSFSSSPSRPFLTFVLMKPTGNGIITGGADSRFEAGGEAKSERPLEAEGGGELAWWTNAGFFKVGDANGVGRKAFEEEVGAYEKRDLVRWPEMRGWAAGMVARRKRLG